MNRIEEAIAALKEGRDTAERYVHEVDHVFAFGMLCSAVQRAVRILEQTDQPAIPDGYIPYDGSGQPVADDVMVQRLFTDGHTGGTLPAGDMGWNYPEQAALRVIAYRIVHDPARLPDVPWEDYPEARWATLNADGLIRFWAENNEPSYETDVWLSAHGTPWDRSPPCDMTHLDPARCKWERPPQRSPRKSIDDAKPEKWNRVAAASNDAHVLRMGLQALQRRVASLERSLRHIDRSR
jgi:hypothetical protein